MLVPIINSSGQVPLDINHSHRPQLITQSAEQNLVDDESSWQVDIASTQSKH
jgi:hypothetical protein